MDIKICFPYASNTLVNLEPIWFPDAFETLSFSYADS